MRLVEDLGDLQDAAGLSERAASQIEIGQSTSQAINATRAHTDFTKQPEHPPPALLNLVISPRISDNVPKTSDRHEGTTRNCSFHIG